MGRGEKWLKLAKSDHEEEDEEEVKHSKSPIVLSGGDDDNDDDDEEANEDLSLKIVEKAMLRAYSNNTRQNDTIFDESMIGDGGGEVGSLGVLDPSSPSLVEAEVVSDVKKKKKRKERKKIKKIETQLEAVVVAKEEEEADASKSVEMSANVVLRKLLRGPRYFDPPDSGWGACYNCGEEGHTTVNCTSAKRKKPCFVCGSLEHNAKKCTKGQACFICKKGGHRAKDCPEKYTGGSQSAKICLKCGISGHDMFSCRNDYSPDDLKEIECFICKSFGHLCCVNYAGTGPREVSCYRCGQLGHTGLACTRLGGETTSMEPLSSCYRCGEEGHFARECTSSAKVYPTTSMEPLSSCYKCGEGGHFARECPSSAKTAKRKRELSTPSRRHSKEKRNSLEVRSVPHDLGKDRKNRKTQYDRGFTGPSKSKQRGGWITEDPGDLPRGKAKVNSWKSPATPIDKNNRVYGLIAGGHASTSRSPGKGRKLQLGNSSSNESDQFYQPRFSASKFGNYSSDGMRRNYDW